MEKDIRNFTLKHEINVGDLFNGQEFELDEEADLKYSEEEDRNHKFSGEEMLKNLKLECTGFSADEKNDNNVMTPFECLINQMEPIYEDQVYKKIIKHGSGETAPKKSIVILQYNGYLEYNDEPFDSTRLRNIPKRFVLGDGHVIPGLDIAAETMRKGEISQFIIRPDYAFGRIGIPPRIPENSTVLFELEMVNFVETSNAIEYQEMSDSERKQVCFENVLKSALTEHQFANDFFKRTQYDKAVAKYKKAAIMLENATLKNQQEEDECNKYLLKLYTNLSICFCHLSEKRYAIIYSNKALQIDENNTKALFRHAKALTLDGQYSQARNYLLKAKKNEPVNSEIIDEIGKLEVKEKEYRANERDMCRKMFYIKSDKEEKLTSPDKFPVSEKFIQQMEKFLEEQMKNQDVNEIPLSSGLSVCELAWIKSKAKSLGFIYVSDDCDFKNSKLVKPSN